MSVDDFSGGHRRLTSFDSLLLFTTELFNFFGGRGKKFKLPIWKRSEFGG